MRVTAFCGVLAGSAALVGAAASGTGAYFSDSHTGTIQVSTGHIRVAPTSSLSLNYSGLLPGDYQTNTITYQAQPSSGTEDIWMVFPSSGGYQKFTGAPTDTGGGGLGRYGFFQVKGVHGLGFVSGNLAYPRSTDKTPAVCATNANGDGGSATTAANKTNPPPPYCPVPQAILLGSNLPGGYNGSATVTFGYTGLLTGPQDAPSTPLVGFQIVATQHGIAPGDPNNSGPGPFGGQQGS
ncbi:hypothetical protein K6U06_15170 [Acidiferrimicrobium sp. IK]|uniref:hypothetical protein n=1 Tax=Acidiferrimicrobium sp. IK TaxID=2871700 RepID=UPI0021CB3F5B|nr:hypothetical protein [Acidiferrimicrobium sp. IK]MCU4185708.1 hypothetical protein [Acidiferrimicrobium sp. IK]